MAASSAAVRIPYWSTTGFLARVVLLAATGTAWTVVSLQSVLLHPAFWEPATFLDWFAVWAYTAAWLLTAGAILVFGEVAQPDTLMRRTIIVVAIASAVTGVANALEDGFEMSALGTVYVIGIFTAALGLLFVAAMTWAGTVRRLWFVPGVAAVAVFTTTLGGGPLALVAWLGLAVILARGRSSSRSLVGSAPLP